jgi:aryl-alcohol dehydrogenase-like predicted oxidoreductase
LCKQAKSSITVSALKKVEEALKAIEYPNVKTVQIIFNMFRLRPSELFFRIAQERNVGILARVPLASGLLTGKMTPKTQFDDDDHRQYNRHGEAFDVGETFSGVPYEQGLQTVERIRQLLPDGATMAQFALRWILMFDAVTCAIPGAKNVQQATDNAQSASLPALDAMTIQKIQTIYDEDIRPYVHHRW